MDEKEKAKNMEALLKRLVDIDWCIGYELTADQMCELDDIRTRAYEMFSAFAVQTTKKEEATKPVCSELEKVFDALGIQNRKDETITKTAQFIKDLNGTQKLYRLNPPLSDMQWDDGKKIEKAYEYVVVSATHVAFSGPKTYILGSEKDGKILCWTELPGSFQGGIDHEMALENAGYTIGTIEKSSN